MTENENAGSELSPSQDLFETTVFYTDASTGQRFVNWLVDNLLMRFGLSYLTGSLVGFLLGVFFPEYMLKLLEDQSTSDLLLIGYIIAILNYILYYTLCEKLFRGYTLGKLISGTRAIREDGGELTFRNALLRTLSRLVPFEVLSALWGQPWHDTWTDTRVIKAR